MKVIIASSHALDYYHSLICHPVAPPVRYGDNHTYMEQTTVSVEAQDYCSEIVGRSRLPSSSAHVQPYDIYNCVKFEDSPERSPACMALSNAILERLNGSALFCQFLSVKEKRNSLFPPCNHSYYAQGKWTPHILGKKAKCREIMLQPAVV